MVLDLNTEKDLQFFLNFENSIDSQNNIVQVGRSKQAKSFGKRVLPSGGGNEVDGAGFAHQPSQDCIFNLGQNGDTEVASTVVTILENQELVLIVDNLFDVLGLSELIIKLEIGSKLTIIERNNLEINEALLIEHKKGSEFVYQKLYESSGNSVLTVNQIGDNCTTKIQNIVRASNIKLAIDQKVFQRGKEQIVEHKTKFILDNNSDLKVAHYGQSCVESAECIIDQKIKGVILDSDSKVEMQPLLEIDSDSSTSNHGASVGEFDANEIFYLQSRGLDSTQTQKILVDSFLDDFFDNIQPICVRERWQD